MYGIKPLNRPDYMRPLQRLSYLSASCNVRQVCVCFLQYVQHFQIGAIFGCHRPPITTPLLLIIPPRKKVRTHILFLDRFGISGFTTKSLLCFTPASTLQHLPKLPRHILQPHQQKCPSDQRGGGCLIKGCEGYCQELNTCCKIGLPPPKKRSPPTQPPAAVRSYMFLAFQIAFKYWRACSHGIVTCSKGVSFFALRGSSPCFLDTLIMSSVSALQSYVRSYAFATFPTSSHNAPARSRICCVNFHMSLYVLSGCLHVFCVLSILYRAISREILYITEHRKFSQ